VARTTGRDAGATRELVLRAAAAEVGDHGLGASMDAIAQRAGVSKGGLLYHFPSKDALIVALADDVLGRYRASIESHLDPRAGAGRLTRAVVLASLDAADDESERDRTLLLGRLLTIPGVRDRVIEDNARWREELAADGLEPAAQAVVLAAADGVSTAALWAATPSRAERDMLRERLLAMVDAAAIVGA
jgi:AcrR family transcriptional regulator